jgi:hypothetical protein
VKASIAKQNGNQRIGENGVGNNENNQWQAAGIIERQRTNSGVRKTGAAGSAPNKQRQLN